MPQGIVHTSQEFDDHMALVSREFDPVTIDDISMTAFSPDARAIEFKMPDVINTLLILRFRFIISNSQILWSWQFWP